MSTAVTIVQQRAEVFVGIVSTNHSPSEKLDESRSREDARYEELVRCYGGKMLSVATRIVGNREDAKDCVQDAFLQAFKNMDRFEERSSLWTWLHRIVVNCSLLKLRYLRRHPEGALDDLAPTFDRFECRTLHRGPTIASQETLLERKEFRRAVRDCIERLPDGYRTVLMLRDIQGLTTMETANMLQMKPGTVKMRLHRARLALKRIIESGSAQDLSR